MEQTQILDNKINSTKSDKANDVYLELNASSFSECLRILQDNYKKKSNYNEKKS